MRCLYLRLLDASRCGAQCWWMWAPPCWWWQTPCGCSGGAGQSPHPPPPTSRSPAVLLALAAPRCQPPNPPTAAAARSAAQPASQRTSLPRQPSRAAVAAHTATVTATATATATPMHPTTTLTAMATLTATRNHPTNTLLATPTPTARLTATLQALWRGAPTRQQQQPRPQAAATLPTPPGLATHTARGQRRLSGCPQLLPAAAPKASAPLQEPAPLQQQPSQPPTATRTAAVSAAQRSAHTLLAAPRSTPTRMAAKSRPVLLLAKHGERIRAATDRPIQVSIFDSLSFLIFSLKSNRTTPYLMHPLSHTVRLSQA